MAKRKQKKVSQIQQLKLGLTIVLVFLALWLIFIHYTIALLIVAAILGYYIFKFVRKYNKIKEQQRQEEIRRQEILASGIKEIDVMDGVEFEQFLGTLFEEMGCKVEYTPKSGDFGADLVVTNKSGTRLVVQAKRYSKTVGVEAVQQVKAAASHYRASIAFVITNRDFSVNAYELAKTANVKLLSRDGLIDLINRKYNFGEMI